jgi:hypothetical protein
VKNAGIRAKHFQKNLLVHPLPVQDHKSKEFRRPALPITGERNRGGIHGGTIGRGEKRSN